MPMGPMMGWWESQARTQQTPPVAGDPTVEVETTEFDFQPDWLEAKRALRALKLLAASAD